MKDCITIAEIFELLFEYKYWLEKVKEDSQFNDKARELYELEEQYIELIDCMLDIAEIRDSEYEEVTVGLYLKIIIIKNISDLDYELEREFNRREQTIIN